MILGAVILRGKIASCNVCKVPMNASAPGSEARYLKENKRILYVLRKLPGINSLRVIQLYRKQRFV